MLHRELVVESKRQLRRRRCRVELVVLQVTEEDALLAGQGIRKQVDEAFPAEDRQHEVRSPSAALLNEVRLRGGQDVAHSVVLALVMLQPDLPHALGLLLPQQLHLGSFHHYICNNPTYSRTADVHLDQRLQRDPRLENLREIAKALFLLFCQFSRGGVGTSGVYALAHFPVRALTPLPKRDRMAGRKGTRRRSVAQIAELGGDQLIPLAEPVGCPLILQAALDTQWVGLIHVWPSRIGGPDYVPMCRVLSTILEGRRSVGIGLYQTGNLLYNRFCTSKVIESTAASRPGKSTQSVTLGKR
eukprot:scaffold770_cov255-Pinguiococcus_pyrenoidosus.AAC.1